MFFIGIKLIFLTKGMLESQWKIKIEQILITVVDKFDLEPKQRNQLKRRYVFRDTHNKIFRTFPVPDSFNITLLLKELKGYGCSVEYSDGWLNLTFHQERYTLSSESVNYNFLNRWFA